MDKRTKQNAHALAELNKACGEARALSVLLETICVNVIDNKPIHRHEAERARKLTRNVSRRSKEALSSYQHTS